MSMLCQQCAVWCLLAGKIVLPAACFVVVIKSLKGAHAVQADARLDAHAAA